MCQLKLLNPGCTELGLSGSVFSHAQASALCPSGLLLLSQYFLSSN